MLSQMATTFFVWQQITLNFFLSEKHCSCVTHFNICVSLTAHLFPCLGYCEQCWSEHEGAYITLALVLLFSRHKCPKGIAG